jgi:hypothetical protein
MTATTTISPSLGARTWSSAARLAAVIAVFVVLAVSSFALGRSSADTADAGSGSPAVASSSPAPTVVSDACGNAHQPTC